ncbi:MAG: hypothetical protein J6S23_01965 [Clostridia bacterium]|nr:hypothetical protein [Clostridia bacterium]
MSEQKKNKTTILSHIKNQKKLLVIILLLLLGLLLLIVPIGSNQKTKSNNDNSRLEEYSQSIEKKIADMCANVSGVSNVKVTVYFDSGFETIYAYNEENKSSSSGTNSEKKYVTIGSGNDESMVCVLERMPNICGVAIVCKGGGNPLISNQLTNLISSAFGVPKNKIYVAEGKK